MVGVVVLCSKRKVMRSQDAKQRMRKMFGRPRNAIDGPIGES